MKTHFACSLPGALYLVSASTWLGPLARTSIRFRLCARQQWFRCSSIFACVLLSISSCSRSLFCNGIHSRRLNGRVASAIDRHHRGAMFSLAGEPRLLAPDRADTDTRGCPTFLMKSLGEQLIKSFVKLLESQTHLSWMVEQVSRNQRSLLWLAIFLTCVGYISY